ncbi:phosphate transporter [Angomonas deanei]|uniref:Citrate transporter/Sodium:sulfate symporter transmembrane region containing protein, putative n=1 Tax=Angomonas deanei TaxID=59799 RepID=A0A7G2CIG0_9TRYP|nr:phosphate transporter [Angomonas deanei]CAD2218704.1 Citrate transporter/Sodium:sulfate symporter transmembrane region containing protein, putative [Angomonas deanei]|eukprot:EPY23209.1 phosphate transporter [Angomonas deanei]
MGGLTIGKALSRTKLEMYAASALHRWAGHRPPLYFLGVMLSSCVLCAFVSNVAAPLLVLGVVQRTLWEFPEGTNAPHGILLGLAFACNIGGMLSPIASPQNAVAMNALSFHNISFAQWVMVAVPVSLFCVLAAWAIILVVWKPFKDVPYIPLQVVNKEEDKSVSNSDRAIVLIVSFITIVLWVLPPTLFFGDTGIVALIPIVVFFGIGILEKEDFNSLSWHLMFLLAGGNMLGLCARDSHMLDIVTVSLKSVLASAPPYLTLVLVILLVCLITTFVSHTVAAMIMLPIIVKIGFLMPESSGIMQVTPQSLVLLCALMCSGAMAFPISSFPNVNSLLAEDEKGKPYLRAKDFLFCGTAITAVFTLCLITWMVPLTNFVLG